MFDVREMEDKKTSVLYRIIKWFVWLFSPKYKLFGTKNIPEGGCVIVGNHSHMQGPIAGEIYTPGLHDVWCAGEMMHREEVAAYAYQDFWSGRPKAFLWFYRFLSHLITPLAVLIFNSAHTIAVYHDNRLLSTFRETISRLRLGSRVVIFPECYTPHNHIVYDFQRKFVDLARIYYKKTGEALRFVPMYLAPALGSIHYGKPISFDPDAPIEEERERICAYLMDEITRMAVALPEHTVVPYPNVTKKHYGKNLLPEDNKHEAVG